MLTLHQQHQAHLTAADDTLGTAVRVTSKPIRQTDLTDSHSSISPGTGRAVPFICRSWKSRAIRLSVLEEPRYSSAGPGSGWKSRARCTSAPCRHHRPPHAQRNRYSRVSTDERRTASSRSNSSQVQLGGNGDTLSQSGGE